MHVYTFMYTWSVYIYRDVCAHIYVCAIFVLLVAHLRGDPRNCLSSTKQKPPPKRNLAQIVFCLWRWWGYSNIFDLGFLSNPGCSLLPPHNPYWNLPPPFVHMSHHGFCLPSTLSLLKGQHVMCKHFINRNEQNARIRQHRFKVCAGGVQS